MATLTLWAFDINGTLDLMGPVGGAQIPALDVARAVRACGGWFGTASGMTTWMQLKIANERRLRLDFVVQKHELLSLVVTVEQFYPGCDRARLIFVGDNPSEDPLYGRAADQFIYAHIFKEGWLLDEEGYIRRLSETG